MPVGTIRNIEIDYLSIYDVAAMVMQQKEMYKFNINLGNHLEEGPAKL